MRLPKLISCAVFLIAAGQPTPVPAAWTPGGFPGEGKRTAQGCAAKSTDDTFVCVFVRCDGGGRLGFYATAPGPDVYGLVRIAIDGVPYPVNFLATPNLPLPDSNRAEVFPDALRAAMKTGRVLKILGADLNPGYDTISLKGAGPAIARVETGCRASGAGSGG